MLLTNALARRLFLHRHLLAEPPLGAGAGQALADLISQLGFVQVDSINTLARAHHMILFSRRQTYRPEALKLLLEDQRQLWEHWTHDASIIPIGLHPLWQHRFARDAERLRGSWKAWFRDGYEAQFDDDPRSDCPRWSGNLDRCWSRRGARQRWLVGLAPQQNRAGMAVAHWAIGDHPARRLPEGL